MKIAFLKIWCVIALFALVGFSAEAVTLLMVPQGGTGAGTFTAGHILQGNGTGAIQGSAMSGDATLAVGGALTISANAIEESMLKAVNAPTDEYALTYESTTGDFEWQSVAGGGDMLKSVYDTDTDNMVDTAEDLTCTDCINATEIEDLYILKAGYSTGALTSDLNIDSNGFVISYDDNKIGLGTATPAYKLDVVGSIQTDSTFRGDTWVSATGNSMSIQPTGDMDDYFSFKTPADRPTIKREGGKYIYIESSNVNDVGISFRKDADHSGTVNYYKDTNEFGMTSKDPLIFKVCEDYDDYIKICAVSNVPEMSTVGAADFKINAGGANNLLLNHSGGNVGIGDTTPAALLTVGDGDDFQVSSTGVVTFAGTGDIDLPANSVDEADLKAVNAPTDEYALTYESTTGDFEWQNVAGGGDINDVFDCSTGDCNTMTVGTSEWLVYGSGFIDANRFAGVTTIDAAEFGYLNGLTAAIVQVGSASHDGFSDYVANEHLDWTADLGATNIHSGNYTDTNTTYTAGRSLTLDSTTINADSELYHHEKCLYFEDPVAADDFKSLFHFRKAATITGMWCESDQTVNMDLQLDDGTPADINGTDLVCDSTPADDTSLGGDTGAAAGERLDLVITSVSGTPTWVSICFDFTYDD